MAFATADCMGKFNMAPEKYTVKVTSLDLESAEVSAFSHHGPQKIHREEFVSRLAFGRIPLHSFCPLTPEE